MLALCLILLTTYYAQSATDYSCNFYCTCCEQNVANLGDILMVHCNTCTYCDDSITCTACAKYIIYIIVTHTLLYVYMKLLPNPQKYIIRVHTVLIEYIARR